MKFKYQIDIQIWKWFVNNNPRLHLIYKQDSGIKQNLDFPSDSQIRYYSKNELYNLLPLPVELIDIIYKHLSFFYQKQKNLFKYGDGEDGDYFDYAYEFSRDVYI